MLTLPPAPRFPVILRRGMRVGPNAEAKDQTAPDQRERIGWSGVQEV
jgi:hypothetical protein